MAKVPIGSLKAGMRLSKPVTNNNGMVMLGEDTELTEALIERIRDMDVGSVYVQGMNTPEVPLESLLSQLDARFRNSGRDPAMALIKDTIREHLESLYE